MIIYRIINKVNQKCYIGQSIHPLYVRKTQHKHASIKNSTYLYKAIRKYGWDNFTFDIIDNTCQTLDELNDMEFHYIKQYLIVKKMDTILHMVGIHLHYKQKNQEKNIKKYYQSYAKIYR